MADFTALKTAIQTYIKQNGNEEITGNILQEVLLAMVQTMGDGAINDLVTALSNEVANRQNADGTLQNNITAEASERGNADTALGGRLTIVEGAITAINTKLSEGYVYAGIATPSTNPGTPSGKVFYFALTAGTYTNFGGLVCTEGITILKYDGANWTQEKISYMDGGVFDVTAYSGNEFASLSALLSDANLNTLIPTAVRKGGMSIKFVESSDNNYVQYRLMKNQWSATPSDWQKESFYNFNIFNTPPFSHCIKELYISDSSIDLSEINCGRLYNGSNSSYGIILCRNNDFSDVVVHLLETEKNVITEESGNYAVIDWERLADYCERATYKDFQDVIVDENIPHNLAMNPSIQEYINSKWQDDNINYLLKSGIFVSNNKEINDCIKELYITNQNIDVSQYSILRIYYGSSNLYGVEIFKAGYTDNIRMAQNVNDVDLTNPVLTDGASYYVLLDWEKIHEYAGSAYKDWINISLNTHIKDVAYWPAALCDSIRIKADREPIYNSKEVLNSGGVYDGLFGGVSKDVYDSSIVKVTSTAQNITYTTNVKGRIVANVQTTGDTVGFYFGYGNTERVFKANKTYKFVALFKNEGFSTTGIKGIIRKKPVGGSNKNTTFNAIVDGSYIRLEYEVTETNDFTVTWFCLYQNGSQSNDAGDKIIYLDFSVYESTIDTSDSLDGKLYKRIKEISRIQSETAGEYQNIINVYPNNTPCQIANLIRSITDASPTNKYMILVHDGEYQETDIITKDYVDIEGEHYNGAILVHNSNATYNSPNNYSFGPDYSNIPVNTIPSKYKHLIYHMSNSCVRNLTFETVTTDPAVFSKYICHQDSGSTKFTAIFEHCNFVNGSGSQIIGIGAKGGEFFKYKDCQFFDNRDRDISIIPSFNLHNKEDNTEPCGVSFEECNFVHCGWIHVAELGSGHTDNFDFNNCTCDNPDNVFVRFNAIEGTEDYCIVVRVVGGNLGGVVQDDSRKDAGLTAQAGNITAIYNANTIIFGKALTKGGNIASNANDGYVFKLTDVSPTHAKTVNNFNVGFGYAVAGNYAEGDNVYINNGVFSKTANGNVAGKVVIAAELSENGYVMIRKN